MKTNDTIKLPANCTALTSQEQREATGGASAETVVKAVVALGVAGVAAGSVLGLFRGQGGLGGGHPGFDGPGQSFHRRGAGGRPQPAGSAAALVRQRTAQKGHGTGWQNQSWSKPMRRSPGR